MNWHAYWHTLWMMFLLFVIYLGLAAFAIAFLLAMSCLLAAREKTKRSVDSDTDK
jgi:hypothetical protein